MPFEERKIILKTINVDEVVDFDDDDKGQCIQCIRNIKKIYPNDEDYFLLMAGIEINENIPEMSVEGIKFEFGVGGMKKRIHLHGF